MTIAINTVSAEKHTNASLSITSPTWCHSFTTICRWVSAGSGAGPVRVLAARILKYLLISSIVFSIDSVGLLGSGVGSSKSSRSASVEASSSEALTSKTDSSFVDSELYTARRSPRYFVSLPRNIWREREKNVSMFYYHFTLCLVLTLQYKVSFLLVWLYLHSLPPYWLYVHALAIIS